MPTLLLQQGRIIDPASQRDETGSLLIDGNRIVGIVPADTAADRVLDARDKIIARA
ncbi:MAG: hypothetical protein R3C12_20935 [Planctomycetaceae bacterium]